MARLALVALTLFAAAGASLPDSTVTWNGMFHVRIHCGDATQCKGQISVRAPDADASQPFAAQAYAVAAGKTETEDLDPAGGDNRKIDSLSSVIVRLEPSGGEPFEATMKLVKDTTNSPSPTSPSPKPLGPPTKSQHVTDKRGDSHDDFGMDLVFASATRKGRTVIFKVRTAKPPPNQHDSQGNPIAPCFEIANGTRSGMQSCGDARLRGYTMKYWPKVKFSLRGATARWVVPFKYLPKRKFKWRAYLGDVFFGLKDRAPNKGYLTFIR